MRDFGVECEGFFRLPRLCRLRGLKERLFGGDIDLVRGPHVGVRTRRTRKVNLGWTGMWKHGLGKSVEV
jgi:hypothetical protein